MRHLKTFLFFEGNKVANETVLAAALSNSEFNKMDINLLFAFAMTLKTVGRQDDTQVTLADNKLLIDEKINGNWENVLMVEEVGIFEMPVPSEDEEEVNILAGTKN